MSTLPSSIPQYSGSTTTTTASGNSLGTTASEVKDSFMKLLLAQIRNQDPLNPQDPGQMTSQLAQLNVAGGIETLNSRMASLLGQLSAQSLVTDAPLVGKAVLAPGSSMSLGAAGGADFGLRLDTPSAGTVLKVIAADGHQVDEISLGALAGGTHHFSWDGLGLDGRRAPAGTYQLQLTATDAAGAAIQARTLTYGVVASLRREGDAAQLLTTDGRSVAVDDVMALK